MHCCTSYKTHYNLEALEIEWESTKDIELQDIEQSKCCILYERSYQLQQ